MNSSFSKSLGLFLISLLNITTAFAQLTGAINVGTGQTYTTLTAPDGLFNAINNGTVTGDIMIQITSDITEPGSIALNKWVESGTGHYQIRIVPDGTTERVLSGNAANMINLSNVRNIVIDGSFSGSGKYLRFINTHKNANTLAFLNDCKRDTVMNCNFEGVDTNRNKSVILIGTTNIVGGTGNDSIVISNNVIKDNAAGFPKNLIRSAGTTATPNDDCIISGNEFINWSNDAVGLAAGTGDNWKILNNAFYQSPTASILTSFYGIRVITGNGHIISGNSIGGQASDRSGAAMKTASSSMTLYSITAIAAAGCGSLSNPTLINQNKISNIAGEFSICGIKADTSNVIIDSNIVDNLTIPNATYIAILSLTGINMTRCNATVTNNTVRNIQNTTPGGFGPPTVSGITGSGIGNKYVIDGNIVDSIVSSFSTQNPNYVDYSMPAGISITLSGSPTTNKISNNKISNIINKGSSLPIGIRYSSTNTANTNIFNNKITNVEGLYSGNSLGVYNTVIGIDEAGAGIDTIYNNMINIGISSYYSAYIYGIRNSGNGTRAYYNNTVNIVERNNQTSIGYESTTAAYNGMGGNVLLKNNIFINKRLTMLVSGPPTIQSYAIKNTSASSFNSDYNLLSTRDSIVAISGTSARMTMAVALQSPVSAQI